MRLYTAWGDTQLRLHLRRLEEMEYLLVHRGGRGQSFVYELMFERKESDDKPVLPGLIDVDQLRRFDYDKKNAGVKSQSAGSTRGHSGGSRGMRGARQRQYGRAFQTVLGRIPQKPQIPDSANHPSS